MANVKISALPSYTGSAADLRWFVMNNSGQTETFKYSGYSSPLKTVGTNNRIINSSYDSGLVNGDNSIILGCEIPFISGGSNNVIIGGFQSSIVGNASYSYILSQQGNISGGTGNGIFGGGGGIISGGSNNYNAILGGVYGTISGGTNYSAIIGGQTNVLTGAFNSTMIGCLNRTSSLSNTTHIENLFMYGKFNNNVYTGSSSDVRWFLMTDSGQTTTYKFSGYTSPFIVENYSPSSIFSTFGTPAVYDADCVGSVVIGSETAAYDDYTTLIGWKAIGNNDIEGRCTAVGADAQATSRETAAFGMSTRAAGYASTSLGHNAETAGERAIAVGNRTRASAFRSITIGQDIQNSSPYGTLINGVSNTLNSTGNYNNIFNGTGNSITGTTSGATMISCSGRTATRNDATFVENLVVFNYAGLNFADDTAAAAGGVVLGQVYHTGGVLKIRIV
jgi:hypothetical protein